MGDEFLRHRNFPGLASGQVSLGPVHNPNNFFVPKETAKASAIESSRGKQKHHLATHFTHLYDIADTVVCCALLPESCRASVMMTCQAEQMLNL